MEFLMPAETGNEKVLPRIGLWPDMLFNQINAITPTHFLSGHDHKSGTTG